MTHKIAQPFAAFVLTAGEAFAAVSPIAPLATFPTERGAQDNCPNDIVVWADPPSRTYYYRGQDRYRLNQGPALSCAATMQTAPGCVRHVAAAERSGNFCPTAHKRAVWKDKGKAMTQLRHAHPEGVRLTAGHSIGQYERHRQLGRLR
jgi:hypothetical protein